MVRLPGQATDATAFRKGPRVYGPSRRALLKPSARSTATPHPHGPFVYIGSDPFTEAEQLRFHTWGDYNYGILKADQDGGGVAEWRIFVIGKNFFVFYGLILKK